MKKNNHEAEQMVAHMLNGFVHTHPQMDVVSKYKVIKKKYISKNKVSLISGGGCGHESAHAGFIGKGMLDAAVYSDTLDSPSLVQVYQCIKETAGNKGILLIISSLNNNIASFKNAAHLAAEDGIEVDYVNVDDSIVAQDSPLANGHRGVSGTIFVHKIAGASAEKGKNLSEVKRVAEKTTKNVKSMGFSLTSGTTSSDNKAVHKLKDTKIEYDAGADTSGKAALGCESLAYARNLAKEMIDSICAELRLSAGKRVALMINGFGASPLMGLYLFCNDALRILSNKGCIVSRTFVANLMTANNTNTASISVLKLDDELESLLNAPCDTPAFKVNGPADVVPYRDKFALIYKPDRVDYNVETSTRSAILGDKLTLDNFIYIVDVICESIIRNEAVFSKIDTRAGDGNLGICLAKGFKQLKKEWKSVLAQPHLNISSFLDACSLILMEHCDNTSGLIWGSAFRAASRSVIGKKSLTICDFAQMLKAAVRGIYDSGERLLENDTIIGEKFLNNALIPYTNSWILNAKKGTSFLQTFKDSAYAAVNGIKDVENTVEIKDRASVANKNNAEAQDASAYALGVIFTDVANAVK